MVYGTKVKEHMNLMLLPHVHHSIKISSYIPVSINTKKDARMILSMLCKNKLMKGPKGQYYYSQLGKSGAPLGKFQFLESESGAIWIVVNIIV